MLKKEEKKACLEYEDRKQSLSDVIKIKLFGVINKTFRLEKWKIQK